MRKLKLGVYILILFLSVKSYGEDGIANGTRELTQSELQMVNDYDQFFQKLLFSHSFITGEESQLRENAAERESRHKAFLKEQGFTHNEGLKHYVINDRDQSVTIKSFRVEMIDSSFFHQTISNINPDIMIEEILMCGPDHLLSQINFHPHDRNRKIYPVNRIGINRNQSIFDSNLDESDWRLKYFKPVIKTKDTPSGSESGLEVNLDESTDDQLVINCHNIAGHLDLIKFHFNTNTRLLEKTTYTEEIGDHSRRTTVTYQWDQNAIFPNHIQEVVTAESEDQNDQRLEQTNTLSVEVFQWLDTDSDPLQTKMKWDWDRRFRNHFIVYDNQTPGGGNPLSDQQAEKAISWIIPYFQQN